MSLALTQPPGGLTFNPQSVNATAVATMTVGEVVHVTDSALLAVAPTDASVLVAKQAAATLKCGFYGVVTKEITASSPGAISFSGIHTCDAKSSGTDWTAGMALTVDANGELLKAVDTNIIVAYAMEAVDVSVALEGKVYMAGGPAITHSSI